MVGESWEECREVATGRMASLEMRASAEPYRDTLLCFLFIGGVSFVFSALII